MSLAGAGELAAGPAVLVQAAAGGLDPPRLRHPADPYGVKPAGRDEPPGRRGCTVVAGARHVKAFAPSAPAGRAVATGEPRTGLRGGPEGFAAAGRPVR